MIGDDKKKDKECKIKYQCNVMSSMSEDSGQMMQAISESDELEIFETPMIQ